jgi:ribosomal protein L37AE/L43A
VTTVVDISCPECGNAESLEKLKLGLYRCRDCGTEFGQGDLDGR